MTIKIIHEFQCDVCGFTKRESLDYYDGVIPTYPCKPVDFLIMEIPTGKKLLCSGCRRKIPWEAILKLYEHAFEESEDK